MKSIAELLRKGGASEVPPLHNHRGMVRFCGLRPPLRLSSRSSRIIPAFRKQWTQTAEISSSHSE